MSSEFRVRRTPHLPTLLPWQNELIVKGQVVVSRAQFLTEPHARSSCLSTGYYHLTLPWINRMFARLLSSEFRVRTTTYLLTLLPWQEDNCCVVFFGDVPGIAGKRYLMVPWGASMTERARCPPTPVRRTSEGIVESNFLAGEIWCPRKEHFRNRL